MKYQQLRLSQVPNNVLFMYNDIICVCQDGRPINQHDTLRRVHNIGVRTGEETFRYLSMSFDFVPMDAMVQILYKPD